MSLADSPSIAMIFFHASRHTITGGEMTHGKKEVFYSRHNYDYNSYESLPSIMVTKKPNGLRESRENASPLVHHYLRQAA